MADNVSTPDQRLPLIVGKGLIRAYEARDRETIRQICRATAYRNRGSRTLFEDDDLIADYWTAYYTDHEPQTAMVVEEDGVVVGYLLGCIDARQHMRVMSRTIAPRLFIRLISRLLLGRYRQPQTFRMIRWWFLASWREMPPMPLERYPAHYHCNILREGLGKSYYSTMALLFLDRLESLGVPGLHGQVEEAAAGGPWTRMVAAVERPDLIEYVADKPSTMLQAVLGEKKPMVNRVWGAKIETYRLFLHIVASKFRI